VLDGQVMKVHMAVPGRDTPTGKAPGTVVSAGKNGIEAACADGTVLLTNIQMPGKKAMDAAAFLLGHKIEIGTVLG
jgi:methionyl-tRNA formyltransferase